MVTAPPFAVRSVVTEGADMVTPPPSLFSAIVRAALPGDGELVWLILIRADGEGQFPHCQQNWIPPLAAAGVCWVGGCLAATTSVVTGVPEVGTGRRAEVPPSEVSGPAGEVLALKIERVGFWTVGGCARAWLAAWDRSTILRATDWTAALSSSASFPHLFLRAPRLLGGEFLCADVPGLC